MPTDPLDQILGVIADSKRRLLQVVPMEPSANDNEATLLARPHLARIFEVADATLPNAIRQLRADVASIAGQPLTDTEKRRQQRERITEVRGALTQALAAIANEGERLHTALAPLAAAPKPSVDEAQLAGIKTDLMLVLDRLDPSDVISRIAGFIDEALADRDDVTLWLLTGSPWPRRYVEARGLAHAQPTLDRAIAQRLDHALTGDAQVARDVLAAVDGPRGVNAIAVAARSLVKIELDRIATRAGVAA